MKGIKILQLTEKIKMNIKSMLLALGASLSLTGATHANQFQAENLASGYGNLEGSVKKVCGDKKCTGSCGADKKCDGKCGADKKNGGKCGAKMDKNSEAKCGASTDKKSDAKCGAGTDKSSDGKCGAGKCGGAAS